MLRFTQKLKGSMENLDKNKIEKIVKTRKQAHGYYLKKSKVYQSFVDLEQKHTVMVI